MKKLFIVFITGVLISCHGTESADAKPTDLDRTDNDDTSAKPRLDGMNNKADTTDTTHRILGDTSKRR